jgi:hypothetical protein
VVGELAEAARVYARKAQPGLDAQNNAAEVRLRAKRRTGFQVEAHVPDAPASWFRDARDIQPLKALLSAGIPSIGRCLNWQLATLTDNPPSVSMHRGEGEQL